MNPFVLAAYKPVRSAKPGMVEWTRVDAPSLFKRLIASAFVIAGGIGIVLVLWPDGILELPPEHVSAAAVARAIGAVAAGAVGLMVLLTLWDDFR